MLRFLVVAAVFGFAACGENTVTPSQPDLPFADGDYTMTVLLFDVVSVGGTTIRPSCEGVTRIGNFVVASATIRRIGSEWRARPATAADGDFEMRLVHGGGAALFSKVPIAGSIGGRMMNSQPLSEFSAGSEVRFGTGTGDSASFVGTASTQGYFAQGTIDGPVTVFGPGGESVTCHPGTVRWSMAGPR